ncbi:hypothetical protein L1987_02817 [Smallanthus sonchifolius]|uniref:Uncharacterized protein n=1 Tax=Smallanthus sonchifolius TaxID=185202 RepID=A0ACB9K8X6_9ASTR|nr:hypothetical protein L1987_02817 [Smallanthus sonchifolius]
MLASIKMQSQNHIHHGNRRRPRPHHRDHHHQHHHNHHPPQQQLTSNHHRRHLGCDFGPREAFERKHVVIVMDAMREFSVEPLEWVLKNITLDTCCRITLLGVKPWLTFVSACKTEKDIWTMNIEDLLNMRDTNEWRNDIRSQKAQELVNICLKYRVKPQIESGQGFPKRLLVLERIASAYATWVVFDRHHNKKHIEYVAKKVPCNILVMNNNRDADMIKGRSTTFESNDESPIRLSTSTIPTPTLMLSDEFKRMLQITSP